MYHLERRLARDLYIPELQELIDYGESVETRGRKCVELLDYVSVISEPWHHCILIPSRRWNPWLAMSEALWILAGRNDTEALLPYNSHITDYSDDGETMYGAYGARIYDQIDPLIERLRKDPNDRRAVLQIWAYDQEFVNSSGDWIKYNDLTTVSKDPPCNNLLYFKLRDNKLHMTVICRSNDIHWGLFAVNIPTFGILQEYIAARLGVEIGNQTHLSNSLHVYTDNKQAADITDRMLYGSEEDLPRYPEHEQCFLPVEFENITSHKVFAEMCSLILDGKSPTYYQVEDENTQLLPRFLLFADDFLQQYRERKWEPDKIIYGKFYQDWLQAGQLFVDRVWKKSEQRSA